MKKKKSKKKMKKNYNINGSQFKKLNLGLMSKDLEVKFGEII